MAEVLNLGMAAATNSVMDRGTAMRVRHRIEAVTQSACRVWTMHHHSAKRLGSRIIWATQLPMLCVQRSRRQQFLVRACAVCRTKNA
jgi:hypothetical protein